MKVTLNAGNPPRKLVAVIGSYGQGIFLPSKCDEQSQPTVYIDKEGNHKCPEPLTLEKLLVQDSDRKPVYEGDTVTLQF